MTGASKLLANTLYSYRGMGLSMGTMIAGWDETVSKSSNCALDFQLYSNEHREIQLHNLYKNASQF